MTKYARLKEDMPGYDSSARSLVIIPEGTIVEMPIGCRYLVFLGNGVSVYYNAERRYKLFEMLE